MSHYIHALVEYVHADGSETMDVLLEDALRSEMPGKPAKKGKTGRYGLIDCFVHPAYTHVVYGHIEDV